MTIEKDSEKKQKAARSIEEEIAAQREKLKKLEDRQRDLQRKEREKNHRAVMDLIKAEKLDTVSAEQWGKAMPTIKAALLVNGAEAPQDVQPVKKVIAGHKASETIE